MGVFDDVGGGVVVDADAAGGDFAGLGCWRALEMLLFVFTGFGVLVLEDEMDLPLLAMLMISTNRSRMYLIGATALIGAEHDDIRGSVRELLEMKSFIFSQKL